MDIKLLSTVLGLHCLALVTPGADFLLTLKNTLAYGRSRGFETALGFGLGIALHVSYCAVGIAVLLQQRPMALAGAKVLGSLYLIYLGTLSLQSSAREAAVFTNYEEEIAPAPLACLRQGFLTNALNPKATLFILGLFTSVIPPHTTAKEIFFLGLGMVVLTIVWFGTLALVIGQQGARAAYARASGWLNRIFGTAFIATALWMLAGVL